MSDSGNINYQKEIQNYNHYFLENKDENLDIQNDKLSSKEIYKIFEEKIENSELEEDNSEENELYYIENPKAKNTKSTEDTIHIKSKLYFKTNNNILKKKRGRQIKENNISKIRNIKKIHNKFSTDNLLRKIQVHYLSFIISVANIILKAFNYKEKFYKLDYDLKKKVNKDYFESLKKKKIYEIICNNISKKYKEKNANINTIIYEKIQNNEILKNFFNENYLIFFKDIYYKSEKTINLKKYGLEKKIFLSKDIKMFKDLLKDNNKYDEKNEKYIEDIHLCVSQNYLPENKFLNSCQYL